MEKAGVCESGASGERAGEVPVINGEPLPGTFPGRFDVPLPPPRDAGTDTRVGVMVKVEGGVKVNVVVGVDVAGTTNANAVSI